MQSENFRTSKLTHHTSTPSLNSLSNSAYVNGRSSAIEKQSSLLSTNRTVGSNGCSNDTEVLNARNKSKDLKADQQLRQILGKDTFDNDVDGAKWASIPNVKRRPSVQVNAFGSTYNQHHPLSSSSAHHLLSGLGSSVLADAGDEILESLVKTATTQSRLDNKKKTKSTRFSDRKSCK